jgi:DNA-binding MarR family transcriptional regulator
MADPRPIGYWLKLVDNLIERQFATTLDEHGVTRQQWQLLNVLSRGTATVEQLDEAIRQFLTGDTESSAEHLSELIESAWVDATPTGYEMTERGFTAFGTLSEVVAHQRTAISEGITAQEYAETVGVLEKMARNLGFTG